MSLSTYFKAMFDRPITAEAIRSEIYFLGARHHGEVLQGAVLELDAAAAPSRQKRLLRAVIDQLKRGED